MSFADNLERWIAGLRAKVSNMVLKALIQNVTDSSDIQLVKVSVLANELDDKVERVQNYGFTSVPPAGGEAIVLSVGANRDHPVVIVADSSQDRKKGLNSGEVAVYHKGGAYILFKSDGTIEIKATGKDINIVGGKIIADASTVQLGGTTGLNKLIDSRLIALYNVHTHTGGTIPPSGLTGPPQVPLGPPTSPVETTNTEAK